MADDRDYIDEAQQEARLRFGRELSPEEFAEKFAGHDFEARVHHLKTLRTDETLSVTAAARRMMYERALKTTHETLRKVDR